jgi:hypothetical protein
VGSEAERAWHDAQTTPVRGGSPSPSPRDAPLPAILLNAFNWQGKAGAGGGNALGRSREHCVREVAARCREKPACANLSWASPDVQQLRKQSWSAFLRLSPSSADALRRCSALYGGIPLEGVLRPGRWRVGGRGW